MRSTKLQARSHRSPAVSRSKVTARRALVQGKVHCPSSSGDSTARLIFVKAVAVDEGEQSRSRTWPARCLSRWPRSGQRHHGQVITGIRGWITHPSRGARQQHEKRDHKSTAVCITAVSRLKG